MFSRRSNCVLFAGLLSSAVLFRLSHLTSSSSLSRMPLSFFGSWLGGGKWPIGWRGAGGTNEPQPDDLSHCCGRDLISRGGETAQLANFFGRSFFSLFLFCSLPLFGLSPCFLFFFPCNPTQRLICCNLSSIPFHSDVVALMAAGTFVNWVFLLFCFVF